MEGSEISEDVMKHPPKDTSPFKANLQWMPETSKVDFFDIFFRHFFPSLEGKAAILDKYLSNPRCSGHTKYWVNENVRFHRPDHPDPYEPRKPKPLGTMFKNGVEAITGI